MTRLVADQNMVKDVAFAIYKASKRFGDEMGVESPTACAKAALEALGYEILQEENANG